MQSLEHTTKTVGQGQRLPMNSLWPSTARTRARKCRMSVETARRFLPGSASRPRFQHPVEDNSSVISRVFVGVTQVFLLQ